MATKKEHLYLVSQVDLVTGEKPENKGDPLPTRRVGPGLLSELDLSDAEIKKLPRGVVRSATVDEIEASEARGTAAAARKVADEAEEEQRNAEVERENERRTAAAALERKKAEELAELDEQHEEARSKEREKTVAAVNDAAGIKPAKARGGKK